MNTTLTPTPVACIVDLRTGAVVDTTAIPSQKTALYLKVRDELNVQHGAGTFMTLDFCTATFSMRYFIGKLHPDADSTPVRRLWLRNQIASKEASLLRLQNEQAFHDALRDEVLSRYDVNQGENGDDVVARKRRYLEEMFEGEEYRQLEADLREVRNDLQQLNQALSTLNTAK